MSKQDRQGVRTATDLERRYNFGKKFSDVLGVANDAQEAADAAQAAADKINERMTHEEIFNLLTKDGTLQGLYRGNDGDLYFNGSFIRSGEILADLIKAGVIKSKDGTSVVIDLDNGNAKITGTLETEKETVDGKEYYAKVNPTGIWIGAEDEGRYLDMTNYRLTLSTRNSYINLAAYRGADSDNTAFWVTDSSGTYMLNIGDWCGVWQYMHNADRTLGIETKIEGERAYITGLTAPVNSADAVNKAYVDNTKSTKTLLWQNASPTSSFSEQYLVSSAVTGYDLILIVCNMTTTNPFGMTCVIEPVSQSEGVVCFPAVGNGPSGLTISTPYTRYFEVYSNGGLWAKSGNKGTTVDNTACIPYRVYGIKL